MKVLFGKEKNQYGMYFFTLVFASILLFSTGMISHNAFGDTVVAKIPVGYYPGTVAVNHDTNMIYVTNGGSNSVSVIDGTTNSVVSTITVGSWPFGVGVNPVTNMIYVTNSGHHGAVNSQCSNSVSIINGTTNNVTSTITVGSCPFGVGVNPVTNKIYVADTSGLQVIDGSTNTIVTTIPGLTGSYNVGVNPNTNMIYVTNSASNTLSVIDGTTNSVVSTITVGNNPSIVGVNPNTNMIYVTNSASNTLSVIDGTTNSVVSTITVGSTPVGVGVNPVTNMIYVTNYDSNSVYVIDGTTNSVVSTIIVGNSPWGVGVNPNTNKIYVTVNDDSNLVYVIDGTSPPNTTLQLQVNSQDSSGNTLPGYYTELYAINGNQLDAGYTPYNFTLDNGQNYTVRAEDYGKYVFDHWLDTGSTIDNRTISITSNDSITAVYKTVPQPPTGLTATAVSSSQINLSWTAPTNDGGSSVTSYEIKRSTDDSTWSVLVKNTGSTGTTYSDTGLSPNSTYYYRVFAINDVGTSLRSNTTSATTPILSGAGVTVGPTNTILP